MRRRADGADHVLAGPRGAELAGIEILRLKLESERSFADGAVELIYSIS